MAEKDKPPLKDRTEDEADRARDDVLRRMGKTPPKPRTSSKPKKKTRA